MIGDDLRGVIDSEIKKCMAVAKDAINSLPIEQRKAYDDYFKQYLALSLEGKNVEAEALTNKFKKENGC